MALFITGYERKLSKDDGNTVRSVIFMETVYYKKQFLVTVEFHLDNSSSLYVSVVQFYGKQCIRFLKEILNED